MKRGKGKRSCYGAQSSEERKYRRKSMQTRLKVRIENTKQKRLQNSPALATAAVTKVPLEESPPICTKKKRRKNRVILESSPSDSSESQYDDYHIESIESYNQSSLILSSSSSKDKVNTPTIRRRHRPQIVSLKLSYKDQKPDLQSDNEEDDIEFREGLIHNDGIDDDEVEDKEKEHGNKEDYDKTKTTKDYAYNEHGDICDEDEISVREDSILIKEHDDDSLNLATQPSMIIESEVGTEFSRRSRSRRMANNMERLRCNEEEENQKGYDFQNHRELQQDENIQQQEDETNQQQEPTRKKKKKKKDKARRKKDFQKQIVALLSNSSQGEEHESNEHVVDYKRSSDQSDGGENMKSRVAMSQASTSQQKIEDEQPSYISRRPTMKKQTSDKLTVKAPNPCVLDWVSGMSKGKQRRKILVGMRVKVCPFMLLIIYIRIMYHTLNSTSSHISLQFYCCLRSVLSSSQANEDQMVRMFDIFAGMGVTSLMLEQKGNKSVSYMMMGPSKTRHFLIERLWWTMMRTGSTKYQQMHFYRSNLLD